jgi:1-acyl-sn-glycerol-3-phosphate acyltransferase
MPRFSVFACLRLLLVGLHLLYGALLVALLFRLGGADWRQRLTRNWSRTLLMLLGIHIEAEGGDLARIETGLLACNHISFIDILVINALLPSAFVAKSEVAQWPLIGWISRHNNTVFIERGSRKAAHRTHQHMLQMLGAGQRLAIFPEGTSTAGDKLLPFHAALFQSAIDAAVPVHAVALSYHRADGMRSAAPAYIDDISLVDCLLSVLGAGGLIARVTLATSFAAPLPDRRRLAQQAHQSIATALSRTHGDTPAPIVFDGDPANRGRKPQNEGAQPLRNEVAIMP